LKEGYLLLANSYGFLVHPYLTLKKISRDRSQAAIFGSLWLGAWVGVVIVFLLLNLVDKFFPALVIFAKWGFLLVKLTAAFLLIFSLYLGYGFLFFGGKISPSSIWRTNAQRYRLVGSNCGGCGIRHFPPRPVCPECSEGKTPKGSETNKEGSSAIYCGRGKERGG